MSDTRVPPAVGADPGAAPLTSLPGVGAARAARLAALGLERLQDLWFHLPLRYEDHTRVTPIADVLAGERALVAGRIVAGETTWHGRPQLRVLIEDAPGATLQLRFFHFNRAQAAQMTVGTRLRCFGEVRFGLQGAEMVHPQYQRLAADAPVVVAERLTPIYPCGEGLNQRRLAGLIDKALAQLPDDSALELVPAALLAPLGLASLREALLYVHRPPPDANLAELAAGRHPAQQRLAFEELLTQHLGLKRLRAAIRRHHAPELRGDGALRARFRAALPFDLTGAQQRVAAEIAGDLARDRPMLRLVQGDVGSGKTVVAALAALDAIEAGWQVALMAPTELLAEQHLRNFRAWLEPLGITVTWLAGKVQGKARQRALAAVAANAPMVIGTHALMQDAVRFARLGLVIIDEQHRFGVHQRLSLRDKGAGAGQVPHQLVLTATPIPRTLAMSAYADLDVSSIDELPPGRTPVRTVVLADNRRDDVIARIHAACVEGRQAYWVCTLIEESELLEAQAAEAAHAALTAALPDLRVGLVHGRMKPAEKQAAMDTFQRGDTAVLVATTVIEVGVDVPNASLMVIENAERLGLSQLHQLRGRVGRGSVASSCVLLYKAPLGALARERLAVLRATNDGFRIAEKDLELRGPGEVLGTQQTGRMELRIADLARDAHLLPAVQQIGARLLRDEPVLVDRLVARWFGSAARYGGA